MAQLLGSEMSDEDFLLHAVSEFAFEDGSEEVVDEVTEVSADVVEEEEVTLTEESASPVTETETETPAEEVEEAVEKTVEEVDSVDYKAEYGKLFEPFKAAGKEVTAKSIAEIQSLMKMGVDYSEKMRDMKVHRKTLKMLENNGLLDEAKLSYLIDLEKKNPEAIAKLIKDSELDPLSLDLENNKYTPNDYKVNDAEVELDDVIARIQATDSFTETLDIVRTKWDEVSKGTLGSKPHLLERLNSHVADGTYARVQAEVDRVRTFGGLTGLTDLDAYTQVGQLMMDRGEFNAPVVQPIPKSVSTKPAVSDTELKEKKLKLSPSRKAPVSTTKAKYDPLVAAQMSDEDFMKTYG